MEIYLIDDFSKCGFCGDSSRYVLEWYGVNQRGEDPEVVQEIGSCSKFEHIVGILNKNELNIYGILDGIVDYQTREIEHPLLVDLVNQAYSSGLDEELLRLGREVIYRDLGKGQKLLTFSD